MKCSCILFYASKSHLNLKLEFGSNEFTIYKRPKIEKEFPSSYSCLGQIPPLAQLVLPSLFSWHGLRWPTAMAQQAQSTWHPNLFVNPVKAKPSQDDPVPEIISKLRITPLFISPMILRNQVQLETTLREDHLSYE
jgi:hypothetical protein